MMMNSKTKKGNVKKKKESCMKNKKIEIYVTKMKKLAVITMIRMNLRDKIVIMNRLKIDVVTKVNLKGELMLMKISEISI